MIEALFNTFKYSKKLVFCIVFLAHVLASSPLHASFDSLFKETDVFSDLPTLTTASRLKQNPHTSPATVSIIDQHQIKASGAQTLPELLALAPGFQVFHLNTNRQGVNYHGVNDEFPNQMEIMVNGRSVYLPLLSTVLWHTLGIGIEDIDRVEIIRGSNAATYGSNAFMGAVNFITKTPITESRLRGAINLGAMQTTEGHLAHSGQYGATLYRISAATKTNKGNDLFQDSIQRQYLNGQWVWSPSLKDSISVELGLDKGYSHIGYLYNYEMRFPEGRHYIAKQEYLANHQQLNWSHSLNAHNQLHVHFHRNALKLDEAQPTVDDLTTFYLKNNPFPEKTAQAILRNNPDFRGYREHGNTQVIDIETALERNTGIIHSFSGIGIRRDEASSSVLLQTGDVTRQRVRLFHSSEIQLNQQLMSHVGLMHEHQTNNIHATSARVALNQRITQSTSIRAGISHSERLPSLLERYGNYTVKGSSAIDQANPLLKPERIRSYELGMYHQFADRYGSMDIRVFHEDVSNAIVNVKNRTGTKQNVGFWRNKGFETQLKIQPNDQLWAVFNYSYLINHTGNWDQGDRGQFPGGQIAPRHTFSALANWEVVPDLNVSTAYYAMDRVRWRRSYGTLDAQPKYQRVDVKLAKMWRGFNQQIEIAAVVQNAFHGHYQTFYQDHRFDRKVFLQLLVKMD